MTALKCDRCGKVYEQGFVPDITVHKYIHPYGEVTYDLCDDCMKKLENWLKKKEEQDENVGR